ncbi:MAG: hypothetical protein KAI33_09285, partial [Elusimicrobiales bacterium]|nr:hypothetical protein [Elusimicrobiales bacterium]
MRKLLIATMLTALASPCFAAKKVPTMVSVSADIVEISGSVQKTRGFAWNQMFDFSEAAIPGLLRMGDFERRTNIATSLKLLETEGKAQLLSNPKIITK